MSARTFAGHAGAMKHDSSVAIDPFTSAPSSSARLRLTRRGRVVIGGIVILLLAGLLAFATVLISPQAFASDAASGDQQFHYIAVQTGDSLWSLATELDPKSDPRDLIAEIVQLNQLGGQELEAGQAIAVPLRYSDAKNVVTADSSATDSSAADF